MEMEFLRTAVTVISAATFLAVAVWAYTPARRDRFDRDALMPFSHPDTADEESAAAMARAEDEQASR